MCCICKSIQGFIDWGMECVKGFTVTDMAVFKLSLVSIGALIGVSYAKPLKKLFPELLAIAAASSVYLIWQMVRHEKK